MKSQEQINKIEAVVLYILQHFKEGLDYIKLFKIMYFGGCNLNCVKACS